MLVPTINYLDNDAPEKFNQALVDTGFALLSHHPLNDEHVKALYQEWKFFFNSPFKHKYPYKNETQEGYFPFRSANAKGTTHKDLMEFYNLYSWGKYPEEISELALNLHNQLTELAVILLQWLDQQMPAEVRNHLEMPLASMIVNSHKHLMRIIHYPPLEGSEHPAEVRAAAHEDGNFITLLLAPNMPGLQIKDRQGHWHNVDSKEGDIIINVGDMLKIASQGYYLSTTHQVINPSLDLAKMARLSAPFFVHPREEVFLAPNLTAKQFLDRLLMENGIFQY